MNQFLLRHILESTMICLLVSMVASRIQAAARTRHTIFLIAILKFAVPSAVLSAAGAQIASMIGDSAWFPLAETRISTLLITIWGVIPFRIGHNDLSIASDLILGFWVIGIVVRLNAWRLRVSEANGVMQLATPSMIRAFGRARELLGIERSVDLCICQTAEPPALAGIWRPRVLFPAHLCGKLSQPELEAVFLHELAHAKRMDNLAAAVSHLIACLFWFHPLVWWVEQRLNCERERACDELAIACGAAPQTYAGTIVKVCRFAVLEPAAGISAMAASDLQRRLDLIFAGGFDRSYRYVPRVLVLGLIAVISFFPMAGGYCDQCASTAPARHAAVKLPSSSPPRHSPGMTLRRPAVPIGERSGG